MKKIEIRREANYVPLRREEFRNRFFERFFDPAFDDLRPELEKICERAWDGYIKYRKSPRTKPAGAGFADPQFKLPAEWLGTRTAIGRAQKQQASPSSPSRILIVNGATRSEHSCAGEISKTRRLARHAQQAIEAQKGFEADFLDLAQLADEPLKVIHPARPASRRRCRYATGRAAAFRTMPWGR